ncbi:MAG: FkbM family methyltransferase [Candidatus Omnitrophica bacterium]|nr:FkbM family methyltransferase [Candidatus Omnitrophota bacterium]
MLNKLFSRFNLINAYGSATRNFPFSVRELLQGILKKPCTRIGPRFIESIDGPSNGNDYLRVKIRSVSTPLYWPCTLPLFDLYKVVTECFYDSDWHYYETPETRVELGDVVFDCGAAEGMFTLRVLEQAGRIIIFEPQPVFVASLIRTFGGDKKVMILPSALGSKEGNTFLSGGSLYGTVSNDPAGVPIQITTIDKFVEREGCRVDFIKGDLESFEFNVLKGAQNTIKKYAPKIALTVYHSGNDWLQILCFLRSLVPEYAYKLKGLSYNGGKARPVMLHCWRPKICRN